MTDSRVAVVIPTVDRPAAIARCLDALSAGVALPDEIVVVDQSAPRLLANLSEHVTLLGARGTRLQHVHTPQRGVSRARNRGIQEATTGLIAFTDDDCVPHANWLRALLDACAPDVDAVSGRVLPLPSASRDAVPVSSRTSTAPRRVAGTWPHAPWDAGTGGNLLVRRDALARAGGFDERLGPGAPGRAAEDVELLYRLLATGAILAYEPQAVVYHEMKTRRDRQRSRFPYGYGMGAFLAIHSARGDRTASRLFGRYLGSQLVRALASLRRGRPTELEEVVRSLAGAFMGYAQFRFHPPAIQGPSPPAAPLCRPERSEGPVSLPPGGTDQRNAAWTPGSDPSLALGTTRERSSPGPDPQHA